MTPSAEVNIPTHLRAFEDTIRAAMVGMLPTGPITFRMGRALFSAVNANAVALDILNWKADCEGQRQSQAQAMKNLRDAITGTDDRPGWQQKLDV